MSKVAVVGAVVIVIGAVGGGGYYYASQQAEQKFQEKIKLIKDAFPGATLTYGSHHISIFSQEATMDKVVFKDKDGNIYTADKVNAALGAGNAISSLSIDKIAITKDTNDKDRLTIDHVDLKDAKAEPGWIVLENGQIKKLFLSKVSFGLLDVQNLQFNESKNTVFKIAQYQIKDYGLGKKTDMVLNGLSIKDRRTEFTIGSIKTKQANQAEIAKAQEELIDNTEYNRSFDQLFKGISHTFSITQFDLLSIDDLAFNERSLGTLKIGHYELKDYGLGRKSSQALKDFSLTGFEGQNSALKVASFENRGIDWANLIKIIGNVRFDYYFVFQKSLMQIQKDYINQTGEAKVNSKVAGVSIVVGGKNLSLGSIDFSSEIDSNGKSSEAYTLDNLEFTLPSNSNDEYVRTLREVGYDKISVSGKLNAQYQKDTKAFSVLLNDLTFKDMGIINASLKGIVPLEALYENSQMVLMNPDSKFGAFTVDMQDTGLMEKLIKRMSNKQGISEEEAKKRFVTEVKEGVEDLKKINLDFSEEATKAAEVFFQDPQKTKIQFTSIPTKSISMSDITGKSEQEVFKLFNLQIKAIPVK